MGFNGISSKKSPRVVRGQLLVPTLGVTGGILLGGDVHLYRGAGNTLYVGAGDKIYLQDDDSIQFRGAVMKILSRDIGHLDIEASVAIDLNALAVTLMNTITGSLPAGPEGSIAYDATLNKLVVYTGAAWETVTSV